jgi:hypothetical protein
MRETENQPPWATPQVFLTRKELAKRWRCSISTLKRRETGGKLNPVRIGPRTVLYRLEDVQATETIQADAG